MTTIEQTEHEVLIEAPPVRVRALVTETGHLEQWSGPGTRAESAAGGEVVVHPPGADPVRLELRAECPGVRVRATGHHRDGAGPDPLLRALVSYAQTAGGTSPVRPEPPGDDQHRTLPDSYPIPPRPTGEPSEGFDLARGRCPVHRVALPSGDRVWLLTRHDDIVTAWTDPQFSRIAAIAPDAPKLVAGAGNMDDPSLLFNMDAPEHTRLRRIVQPAFTPQRIERWRPRVSAIASDLVDRMVAGPSPADLVTGLAHPLPLQVICEILGIPAEDQPRFGSWVESLLHVDSIAPQEFMQCMMELHGYLGALVAGKRETPGEDLTSELIAARDAGDRLSEQELHSLVGVLLLAGQETTVNTLSRGALALLAHEDQWRRLADDPDLVGSAVEEVLRYCPPGDSGLMRVARCDITLPSGATVRAGEAVLPTAGAANRDPRRFAEPDRFLVDRQDNRHSGFGQGPHYCLGAALARMELQEAFRALVIRAPKLRLAVPTEEIRWSHNMISARVQAIPVVW